MSPRLLLALMLFSSCAFAQDASTGAVRGTVTDPSHSPISAAPVTLTDSATAITRTAQSDDHGAFVFDFLPPSQYSLTVTASGMAEYKATNIKVDVGGNVTLPITLRI